MTSEWGREPWQLERVISATRVGGKIVHRTIWSGVLGHTRADLDERVPRLLQEPADVRFVRVVPREAISLKTITLPRVDKPKGSLQNVHGDWRWVSPLEGEAVRDSGFAWKIPKLDQVIVAGESEPVHPDWVRSLRDQCVEAGVAFVFEGWGDWAPNCLCDTRKPHSTIKRPEPGMPGVMFLCGRDRSGRELDGRTWDEEVT